MHTAIVSDVDEVRESRLGRTECVIDWIEDADRSLSLLLCAMFARIGGPHEIISMCQGYSSTYLHKHTYIHIHRQSIIFLGNIESIHLTLSFIARIPYIRIYYIHMWGGFGLKHYVVRQANKTGKRLHSTGHGTYKHIQYGYYSVVVRSAVLNEIFMRLS